MDRRIYLSSFFDAKVKLWFACVVIFGLLITVIYMSMSLYKKDTVVTTVITPMMINDEIKIEGEYLSPSYLEMMSNQFSQLLYTYHKANADYQFNKILQYVAPTIYQDMKSRFASEIRRIYGNDISSVFYPSGVSVDGNVVRVGGVQKAWVGSQLVVDSVKYYEFSYSYNGVLRIESIKEKRLTNGGDYVDVDSETPYMIEVEESLEGAE